MSCKIAREKDLLAFYGELDEAGRAALEAHLRSCRECAADADETRRVLALYDAHKAADVPEPDWEKAWAGVRAAVREVGPRRRPAASSGRRWALAGASLALVLALGIAIGRFGLGPRPARLEPLTAAALAGDGGFSTGPALRSHLEEIRPVILEVANAANGPAGEGRVLVAEKDLRGFLLQNLLLKRALRQKDPAAAELLDDLDVVLRQLANAGPDDAAARTAARALIRDRGVVFKLDILKKT
jgi:hypothetical protein